MALCCIGGVCIPYSAIVPLLIYALQWLLKKACATGLLPAGVVQTLDRYFTSTSCADKSCCQERKPKVRQRRGKTHIDAGVMFTTPGEIMQVGSLELWNNVLDESQLFGSILICKFTAEWCKPCKKIQPVFESLAIDSDKSLAFVVLDADDEEFSDVVCQYRVTSLPTFLAFHNGSVVGSYSGSDEDKLRTLVSSAAQKTK